MNADGAAECAAGKFRGDEPAAVGDQLSIGKVCKGAVEIDDERPDGGDRLLSGCGRDNCGDNGAASASRTAAFMRCAPLYQLPACGSEARTGRFLGTMPAMDSNRFTTCSRWDCRSPKRSLRPIVVYVFLVVGLRLAGKRELAQLNPFDLVVLLTLSNTVQNAIIGNDNSITGGLIGAADAARSSTTRRALSRTATNGSTGSSKATRTC